MLGSGSTSKVYKRGKYAVKNYGASFNLNKVVREVFFLTYYKHDNIIQLHKTYISKGELKLKLEYGGVCLARLKDEDNKMNRLAIVIPDILKALCFLHSNGICHRDVSPFNILCADKAKLCDFGCAMFTDSYDTQIMNRYFDSPDMPKSHKSDIYSFMISICYYLKNPPKDEILFNVRLHDILTCGLRLNINERASAQHILKMIGIDYVANTTARPVCQDTDLYNSLTNEDTILTNQHFIIFKKNKYKVC